MADTPHHRTPTYSAQQLLHMVDRIRNRIDEKVTREFLAEMVYQSQFLDSDAVLAAVDAGLLYNSQPPDEMGRTTQPATPDERVLAACLMGIELTHLAAVRGFAVDDPRALAAYLSEYAAGRLEAYDSYDASVSQDDYADTFDVWYHNGTAAITDFVEARKHDWICVDPQFAAGLNVGETNRVRRESRTTQPEPTRPTGQPTAEAPKTDRWAVVRRTEGSLDVVMVQCKSDERAREIVAKLPETLEVCKVLPQHIAARHMLVTL